VSIPQTGVFDKWYIQKIWHAEAQRTQGKIKIEDCTRYLRYVLPKDLAGPKDPAGIGAGNAGKNF
jgi:hypothetical protein